LLLSTFSSRVIIGEIFWICSFVDISRPIDQINLTIEDNGHGFNLNNCYSGNGLANFRRRADGFKGVFSIHSAINEETKIQLSFKIT